MAPSSPIKNYPTTAFREKFIEAGDVSNALLGEGFGWFFIAKVEEMLSFMKPFVPAIKTTTHSFIFLTEGAANMLIGNEKYTIAKHQGLFVPKGQVFSFNNKDKNKGFICNFSNEVILGKFGQTELYKEFEFLTVWGNPKVQLEEKNASFVLHLLERLYTEYKEHGLQHLLIIQSYFIALLCEMDRVYKPIQEGKYSQAIKITNQFKEQLYQHIRQKHSVREYAELLNISPNYLNKVLQKTTRKSTNEWIQEVLILETKVLLFQTSLTIKEIAFEIGVLDPSYFSRLFKKHVGCSPTEYRKRGGRL